MSIATRRRALAIVLALGFVAGCATPDKSMNASMRAALGGVDGLLLVPQSGLDVTVSQTDGGQGGLLGVLIAAAIDKKREDSARKTAAPILEALKDYDFRASMARAVDEESARQSRLNLKTPWRLETVDTESQRRGLLDASGATAVLFLRVDYRLVSGNLVVTGQAQLLPKAAPLFAFRPAPKDGNPVDEGNAIYRKSFSFTRQNLSADTAAAALDEGARSIAAQCLADLGRDF